VQSTVGKESQGRLHKGGNGARCTMAKIGGGNVVMIMMLLVMSIIIIITWIHLLLFTSALLTCCLPFFPHCVSKNIPDVFSYNSLKHCRIFIIFGRNITEKVGNQKMLYFPTSRRLINASALPCETGNMEIYLFHVNVLCWFAHKHTIHIRIIT